MLPVLVTFTPLSTTVDEEEVALVQASRTVPAAAPPPHVRLAPATNAYVMFVELAKPVLMKPGPVQLRVLLKQDALLPLV